MHRAVDDYAGFSLLVGIGNFFDILGVLCLGKALVVHDHIVRFRPVRIIVEINLCVGAAATFINDGPLDGCPCFRGDGECLGLEFVIVAAAAGDE